MQRISFIALPFCKVTLRGSKPFSSAYPRELKTVGDHMRKRRLDLKLLQKDVGQILGVARGTIMVWETNLRLPSPKLIPKIVEFLGYDPLQ